MRRWIVVVLVFVALLAAMPMSAGADTYASGDVVNFAPRGEDQGHKYRFMGRLLGAAYSDHLLLGGEIELAKYETMLAGMPGIQVKSYNLIGEVQRVDTDPLDSLIESGFVPVVASLGVGPRGESYNLNAVVQVVAWPDQLSPYIGGAVGVNVLRLDEDALESVISSVKIDNFGISLGGVAFVGIQLPITADVSLFTEARAGALFDVIDPASVEMGVGGLDGYSGMTGLRMRF